MKDAYSGLPWGCPFCPRNLDDITTETVHTAMFFQDVTHKAAKRLALKPGFVGRQDP